MSWSQEQIDQTLRAVGERSLNDAGFRALALRDPNAAIRQVSGRDVPNEVTVRFVDNAGAHFTIVLPDPGFAQRTGGLQDEDLVGVAGGGTIGILPTSDAGCQVSLICGGTLTACSPLYTKKPNSPALCPHF